MGSSTVALCKKYSHYYFQNHWIILLNLLKEILFVSYLKEYTYKHLIYLSETCDLRIFIKCFETPYDMPLAYTDHEDLALTTVTWVCMRPHVFITCIILPIWCVGTWEGVSRFFQWAGFCKPDVHFTLLTLLKMYWTANFTSKMSVHVWTLGPTVLFSFVTQTQA